MLRVFLARAARRHGAGPLRQHARALSDADGSDQLPQYWRDLERRVVGRKPRTSGPSGRGERRKTEVDYWLEAGLYDAPAKADEEPEKDEAPPKDQ
mmetsp:Transcript_16424/g.49041  ORF Transcript_16424/g.49041 Transcript_16424/m.49041 type:complete len:96 (+) Transcript_16424:86-373(+)